MKLAKKLSKLRSKVAKFGGRAVIAVIALMLLYIMLTRGSADISKIKTSEALQKQLEIQITASGKTTGENESTVHSAISDKVVWVGVLEGDNVARGQVLATLDRERFEIVLRQVQQDVIAADAVLAKVYDDISKTSGVETFDNRIKRTAAEAVKNKAFDAQKLAERNLADVAIVAPISGVVTEVHVNAGENILQSSELFRIEGAGDAQFVAEVDEGDIGKVRLGQKSQVKLDAYGDEPVNSQVSFVGPKTITTATGATAFEVKLPLPVNSKYRFGMNGEATIEVARFDETLVVPVEAVVEDKYVYVKKGDNFEKREVGVGVTGDTEAQILSGIDRRDVVVTGGFDQIGKKSLLDKIISRLK